MNEFKERIYVSSVCRLSMLCDAAAMEKTSGCFPRAIKKKSGPNSPGKRTRKKKPEPTTGAEAAGRRKRKHAYFKESQASEQNRVVSSSACVPLLNIPTIQADPHVNFQELAIDHRQISGSNRSGICLVVHSLIKNRDRFQDISTSCEFRKLVSRCEWSSRPITVISQE